MRSKELAVQHPMVLRMVVLDVMKNEREEAMLEEGLRKMSCHVCSSNLSV